MNPAPPSKPRTSVAGRRSLWTMQDPTGSLPSSNSKKKAITKGEEEHFRQLAMASERSQQKYALIHMHLQPTHPDADWLPHLVKMNMRPNHRQRSVDLTALPSPLTESLPSQAMALPDKPQGVVPHPQVYEREFSQKIWAMVTHSNQRVRTAKYSEAKGCDPSNGSAPAPALTGISTRSHHSSLLFTLTEVPHMPTGDPLSSTARGIKAVDDPWLADVTFNSVVQRDGGGGGGGAHTARGPRPTWTDADEAALRNLAGSPAMFRSMLWYRKQPTETRNKRLRQRLLEEQEKWELQKVSTDAQFSNFNGLIHHDIKALYTRAAKELERWETDRQRLYGKKSENLDFGGLQMTWAKALGSMRRGIKEIVATEYLREQVAAQTNFFDRFEANVRRRYRRLSVPCEVLLERIKATFHGTNNKDKSLKQDRLVELVGAVPHEALLLDDVISVLYSLSFVFRVEEEDFVALLRRRAGILALRITRGQVVSHGHTMSSWLSHIPVEYIGAETVLFVLREHNDFPTPEALAAFLATLRTEVMEEVRQTMDRAPTVTASAQPAFIPQPPVHGVSWQQ